MMRRKLGKEEQMVWDALRNKSDAEAIRSDWQAVGTDLRTVFGIDTYSSNVHMESELNDWWYDVRVWIANHILGLDVY